MPLTIRTCIASWKRHFRDFEFIEWNEANTDLSHPFLSEAMAKKQFAFVSDFVRLVKLKEYGGIYLDTDMYFIRPLPVEFLEQEAFIGSESSSSLSAGIIGSVPSGKFVTRLIDVYQGLTLQDRYEIQITKIFNRTFPEIVPPITGDLLMDWGIVLDKDVFYPLPFKLRKFHWAKFITNRTVAIHLWSGSWLDDDERPMISRSIDWVKYQVSKIYVPISFKEYARSV